MKRIHNFTNLLLCIFIILQCYTLLDVFYDQIFIIACDLLIVICIGLSSLKGKIKFPQRHRKLCICFLLTMLVLIIFGGFKNITFINCVVLMFILFMIYFSKKENLILTLNNFSNTIFVISLISIFFFVFATCLGIIQPTAYYPRSVVRWGTFNYYDYYNVYCSAQIVTSLGYTGYRNIAIFLEGPMLSYVLSLALYCELFLRKNHPRKIVVIVESVAMITSFSTTGILVIIALFGIKFYQIYKNKKFLRWLLIPIIIGGVAYLSNIVFIDKLTYGASSSSIRFDDIIASLRCFIRNPILGVGFENMKALNPYRSVIRSNASLATGIGAVMATGGILLSCWYIFPTGIALYRMHKKSVSKESLILIVLVFILMINTIVHSRIIGTLWCAISWFMIINNLNAQIFE